MEFLLHVHDRSRAEKMGVLRTTHNTEWGIMDQIRLRQMEELQDAMDIWVKYKPKDDDEE